MHIYVLSHVNYNFTTSLIHLIEMNCITEHVLIYMLFWLTREKKNPITGVNNFYSKSEYGTQEQNREKKTNGVKPTYNIIRTKQLSYTECHLCITTARYAKHLCIYVIMSYTCWCVFSSISWEMAFTDSSFKVTSWWINKCFYEWHSQVYFHTHFSHSIPF